MKTAIIARLDADLNPPSWTVIAQTALGMAQKITLVNKPLFDVAAACAELMAKHGMNNPDGAEVMAPPEVLELIPEHLRQVKARPKKERY